VVDNVGSLSEFSLSIRMFLKTYRWRRIDPVPWTPLRKPLAESRVALVSSAGLVTGAQPGFDNSFRGGDPSFREIPGDVEVSELVDTHRSKSFDHSGIERDRNVAFPLDRLRELVEDGRIRSLNHRHLSLMGSITSPGRFVRDHAPEAARKLAKDNVDVTLLIPV
jgi:D-proline reductase (dithiol) PrdB